MPERGLQPYSSIFRWAVRERGNRMLNGSDRRLCSICRHVTGAAIRDPGRARSE
jgi:hypothetical protein